MVRVPKSEIVGPSQTSDDRCFCSLAGDNRRFISPLLIFGWYRFPMNFACGFFAPAMRTPSLRRRIASVKAIIAVGLLLMIAFHTGRRFDHRSLELSPADLSARHRKLLGSEAVTEVEPKRIWGDKCSKSDIVITQGPTSPLPNGIPTYTVEIMNACVSGCVISGIHLSCGWFSSTRLINPRIFKRLRFNDCLVNDGKPLVNGRTISFKLHHKRQASM